MKILLQSPGRTYTNGTVDSLLKFFAWAMTNGVDLFWNNTYSADIYNVRNLLVANGIKAVPDYDLMVWVDSDVVFSVDDIKRLIEADMPVVTGFTPIGMDGKSNVAVFREDAPEGSVISYINGNSLDSLPPSKGDLYPCDMCGFGLVAFKRGVFERAEGADKGEWFVTGGLPFNGKQLTMSEDMLFTRKLTLSGVPIYAHAKIRTGHQKVITMRFENGGSEAL